MVRFQSSCSSSYISSLGQYWSIRSCFRSSHHIALAIMIPMVLRWQFHHVNVASAKIQVANLTCNLHEVFICIFPWASSIVDFRATSASVTAFGSGVPIGFVLRKASIMCWEISASMDVNSIGVGCRFGVHGLRLVTWLGGMIQSY